MNFIPKKNRDLRRYALKKDLVRAIGFLFWMIIWYSGAVVFNNNHQTYSEDRRMVGWRLWLWMALAFAVGFFLFRLWKFFTQRTFRGKIVRNGNSRSYTPSEDPGSAEYDFRLNTKLKIQLPNGKMRRIRFEQKNGFYTYYHEGNEIIRLHGLPYPVNLDPSGKNGYVCSACGTWSKTLPERCAVCNHTVIDPKDLQ